MDDKANDNASILAINKAIISAVFFKGQENPIDLNYKITAAILLLSICDEIIQKNATLDEVNAFISKNIPMLNDKLRPVPPVNFWRLIEDIDYLKVKQAFDVFKILGVKFFSSEQPTPIIRMDSSLLAFNGNELRHNQEQTRIVSKAKILEQDQKLNIQGVAGSGKSTVLDNIALLLIKARPNANIVWLSNSYELANKVAYKYRDTINLIATTYFDFCENLIPTSLWGEKYKKRVDEDTMIKLLGVLGDNSYKQRFNFRLITATINKFCREYSHTLKEYMVPPWIKNKNDIPIILEQAKHYWKLILDKNSNIPIQQNHHIKYVQTRVKNVQRISFDTLLIDEAQDVLPSMLSIIKCITGQYKKCKNHTTQAIMFGDKFQSTQYFNEWGYEFDKKKKIFNPKYEEKIDILSASERVSHEADDLIINTLTSGGHSSGDVMFEGVNPKETEILHCSWADLESGVGIKQNKTIFLVEDVWSAIFAAQVLSHKNIPIYIPPDSLTEIKAIVLSAFDFINEGVIHHTEFSGYANWAKYLETKSKENFLMERIDAIFKKGYNEEHLNTTLSKAAFSTRKHVISLMKYSKGMECDQVYILPNVRKQNALMGAHIELGEANELYVALTRSTHKIFLPFV